MNDNEMLELKKYPKEKLPILLGQLKSFNLCNIKTLKESVIYWHLRMEILVYESIITEYKYYPAEYYLQCMQLAVEELEHYKNISEEALARRYDYWACIRSDFVGEANCAVETEYYPPYYRSVGEEEKDVWRKVIELGNKCFDLQPDNMDKWWDILHNRKNISKN